MKIPTEPGLYKGVPYEVYAQIEAVSASKLKTIHTQSALALHRKVDESSDTLRQGQAGHAAVLEPEKFEHDFVAWPSIGPEGKKAVRRGARWDKFQRANEGSVILTESQAQTAERVAEAVAAHPFASALLAGDGDAEVTILWRDVRTGALIKVRVDWLGADQVELKTTVDPLPRRFSTQSAGLGYHIQYALYADAVATVLEEPRKTWVIAAQNVNPFDVVVYSVDDEMLNTGTRQYQAALDVYLECERTGVWPGVAPVEPIPLRLPGWADDDGPSVGLSFDGVNLEF